MTDTIGAPGSTMTRRDFANATAGSAGLFALAGCATRSTDDVTASEVATNWSADGNDLTDDLPTTSPPEVVNVDEQGGEVTLSSVPARHDVHPGESMGGPVEHPQVWAFRADDGDPLPANGLRTMAVRCRSGVIITPATLWPVAAIQR